MLLVRTQNPSCLLSVYRIINLKIAFLRVLVLVPGDLDAPPLYLLALKVTLKESLAKRR